MGLRREPVPRQPDDQPAEGGHDRHHVIDALRPSSRRSCPTRSTRGRRRCRRRRSDNPARAPSRGRARGAASDPMMPTCVSPKLSACASWTIARTASGGSCAVITQRATALSAAITTSIDGCRVNRGDSANSTISAITPSDPQACNRQSVESGLLPGDRRENVIGGMAALDQRRRHDDSEKAAVAQQRARAAGAPGGRSWCRPAAAARGWPAPRAQPSRAMIQIRCRAAMRSTSSPQTSAPRTKAAEPHSRNGPYLRP